MISYQKLSKRSLQKRVQLLILTITLFRTPSFASFDNRSLSEDTAILPIDNLEKACCHVLCHETEIEDQFVETDQSLMRSSLDNLRITDEGRICVPLLWNGKTSPHLQENFNLAKNVLNSTRQKYENTGNILALMDDTITEQYEQKVITRIHDIS